MVPLNVEIRSEPNGDCECVGAVRGPRTIFRPCGLLRFATILRISFRSENSTFHDGKILAPAPQITSVRVLKPRGKPFAHFSGGKKDEAERAGLVQK